MPIKGYGIPVDGASDDILHSTNSGIRCFTVKRMKSTQPLDDCTGKWETANPQTVPFFTATGYYFGRLLNEVLNVPVGLIHVSRGGSPIEAWMTPASLKDIPEKPIPATAVAPHIITSDAPVPASGRYLKLIHPDSNYATGLIATLEIEVYGN
jgi:sialate O-acetylesterase